MSTQEQDKIIKELRAKTAHVQFVEKSKSKGKLDGKTLWIKAKLAGQTISDDSLSTTYPAGA